MSGRRRVVLVGAGHGHLASLRAAADFRRAGAELVLVAPGPLLYSGMATAALAGQVAGDAHAVDVAALVRAGGGRFVRARARALESVGRGDVADSTAERGRARVLLEPGSGVPGDLLECELVSVGVGSVTRGAAPGMRALATPTKPLEGLVELGRALDARALAAPCPPCPPCPPCTGEEPLPHLVVVGGGPSGCELALCARERLARCGALPRVTLVAPGELLGEGFPRAARERMQAVLSLRGVQRVAERVLAARPLPEAARAGPGPRGLLELEGGGTLGFELLLDAGGLCVPDLVAGSGLACVDGALHVDRTLASIDDRRVFAVGDCAAFEGRALPRVGVYAVRQGPVLRDNLLARLAGLPLRPYDPQRRALLIMNLGGGSALAVRGRLVARGRAMAWWKHWIDRRFLARQRPAG